MKNTMVEFSYSFIVVALGFVLTGHFINLIIFSSIIFIHELGHCFFASLFKVKIKKIIFYPYGGKSEFNYLINIDIYKELLISVGGFIFQWIYFFIIYILYRNGFIREYSYTLFYNYNLSIFIFNLFPIIPLDGYKILSCILNYFFCYKFSSFVSIFISFISIILFIFLYRDFNYSYILILSVLLKNIYEYIYNIKYIYNKFLLERYLYDIKFKNKKIINDKYKFYRNNNHYIKQGNIYMKEKDYLNKLFDK